MSTYRTWTYRVALSLGLLMAGLPAFGSEFSERLAAWQGPAAPPAGSDPVPEVEPQPQPAHSRVVPTVPAYAPHHAPHDVPHDVYDDFGPAHGGACGPGCGTCGFDCGNGCGYGGASGGCGSCSDYGCNTMVWARFEVLLWWRQGRDLPPLVTTDPVTEPSTTAGVLPDATILFGGEAEHGDMSVGGRFDIGTWFDPRQCYGVGWRFFGLGNDGLGFGITSLDNPVLAVPIFDFAGGVNNAVLLAYPGFRSGNINITGDSEVLGNDVYGRILLCRTCNSRWDFITGWHFSRVNDQLDIAATSVDADPGSPLFGTETTFRDRFAARNEFHGGILGFIWERECGCFSTQLLGRMAIGSMHEQVTINGTQTVVQPGQNPETFAGGIFTAASNIGTFERSEFTAVTEVGVTCSYRVGHCTELTLGYTFMYWNDVMRPGDAIDPRTGTAGGETHPQFEFNRSGYWVQGLNLGFTCKF